MTKRIDFSQVKRPGSAIFALATCGLGVLGLVYGDFALQWQPVPDWLPWRHGVAYVSAALLLWGCVIFSLSHFVLARGRIAPI